MIYHIKELRLDTSARSLSDGTGAVRVSARAFDALLFLLEHRARAVGRDELIRCIWRRENVSDAQLAQIILLARRAVGDHGELQSMIRTVPGFGYQWVGRIEAGVADTSAPTPSADAAPAGVIGEARSPASPELADDPASRVRAGEKSVDTPRRVLPWQVTLSLAFAAAIAVVVGYVLLRAERRPESIAERVIVLPIEVAPGPDTAWVRLGIMDLIAGRLRASGLIVPPTENVLQLIGTHGMDSDADRASIKQAAHAGILVQGNAEFGSADWRVEMRARKPDGLMLQVEGRGPEVVGAAIVATDRLLSALGRQPASGSEGVDGYRELLQQAKAASLGNDFDRARAILAGAPEPQRSSLEIRLQLAMIDSRAGRLTAAEEEFSALLEEKGPEANSWLRARALLARGALKLRRNDADAGGGDFDAAVRLLDDGSHPLTLGNALNGRAIAHRRHRDFAAAISDYGRARMALERAGDDFALGKLSASLGTFETQRYNWLAALEHFQAAAQQFETYGAINELSTTTTNIAMCQGELLRWQDALLTTDRSVALLPRVVDPGARAQILLGRAQVLLAIGRLREARTVIEDVRSENLNPAMIEYTHAQLLYARLAWEAGDAVTAAAEAGKLWEKIPVDDPHGFRSQAAWISIHALLATGDAQGAARIAAELVPVADGGLKDPVIVSARAAWLISVGKHIEAESELRRAMEIADSHNSGYELALAADALARLLATDHRIDEAAALVGQVVPYAEQDYRCAQLLVWLHRLQRNDASAAHYLAIAKALAGERRIVNIENIENIPLDL